MGIFDQIDGGLGLELDESGNFPTRDFHLNGFSESGREPEPEPKPDPEFEPKPTQAEKPKIKTCSTCGESEFWIDYQDKKFCSRCQPAPNAGMIKQEFFYDDSGNQWIVSLVGQLETWTKTKNKKSV